VRELAYTLLTDGSSDASLIAEVASEGKRSGHGLTCGNYGTHRSDWKSVSLRPLSSIHANFYSSIEMLRTNRVKSGEMR